MKTNLKLSKDTLRIWKELSVCFGVSKGRILSLVMDSITKQYPKINFKLKAPEKDFIRSTAVISETTYIDIMHLNEMLDTTVDVIISSVLHQYHKKLKKADFYISWENLGENLKKAAVVTDDPRINMLLTYYLKII